MVDGQPQMHSNWQYYKIRSLLLVWLGIPVGCPFSYVLLDKKEYCPQLVSARVTREASILFGAVLTGET